MQRAALARLLAFGIAVQVTYLMASRACGGSLERKGPRGVPLQPPPWVFAVVWPLLYALIGIAWAGSSPTRDAMFGALTVACCAWLPLYMCTGSKGFALITVFAAATIACALAARAPTTRQRLLLLPACGWLAFATYLGAWEVLR